MSLTYRADAYGGVIVDPEALPKDPQDFGLSLKASLGAWKEEGKRGVWIKVREGSLARGLSP